MYPINNGIKDLELKQLPYGYDVVNTRNGKIVGSWATEKEAQTFMNNFK